MIITIFGTPQSSVDPKKKTQLERKLLKTEHLNELSSFDFKLAFPKFKASAMQIFIGNIDSLYKYVLRQIQVMCESDEEEGSWLSQNMPCFVGAHRIYPQQHIVN